MSLYPVLVQLHICEYPKCKWCGKPNEYKLGMFSANGCCKKERDSWKNWNTWKGFGLPKIVEEKLEQWIPTKQYWVKN